VSLVTIRPSSVEEILKVNCRGSFLMGHPVYWIITSSDKSDPTHSIPGCVLEYNSAELVQYLISLIPYLLISQHQA
jgi:hypothetical protein